MASEVSPARLRSLGSAVTAWGSEEGATRRDELPWRSTRDPWAVLVSEVMAQQTQLARVVPAYRAFLARFPTPAACAEAPLGEVLRLWAGMGYNRRAQNLQRAATWCVEHHRGLVPDTLEALLALPGVGPYTARAVLAFAFEVDVGIVDTNAGRVLARAVAGRNLRPAEAQEVADAMVPSGSGWAFGQALLDLGATVCTSRSPSCAACPLGRRCLWNRAGRPDPDPARGSAGVSTPQSPFAGSDRQGRGRLVDALRAGPVPWVAVAEVMGWHGDPERAERVARGLVADGLVIQTADALVLP